MSSLETTIPRRGRAVTAVGSAIALVASVLAVLMATASPAAAQTATPSETETPPQSTVIVTLDPACTGDDVLEVQDPEELLDGFDIPYGGFEGELEENQEAIRIQQRVAPDDYTIDLLCNVADEEAADIDYEPFTLTVTEPTATFEPASAPAGGSADLVLVPACSGNFDLTITPEHEEPIPFVTDPVGGDLPEEGDPEPPLRTLTHEYGAPTGDITYGLTCEGEEGTSAEGATIEYEDVTFTIEPYEVVIEQDNASPAEGETPTEVPFSFSPPCPADEDWTFADDADESLPEGVAIAEGLTNEGGTLLISSSAELGPFSVDFTCTEVLPEESEDEPRVITYTLDFAVVEGPSAPLDVQGVPGNRSVTVSWDPPQSNGGSPIAGYLVLTLTGQGCGAEGNETSCTVTGLTNGVPYFFVVTAVNEAGEFGAASQPSALYRPRPNVLPSNGFNDVPRNSFYAVPVDWAKLFGITTGIGGTNRFAPSESLLRNQIITFLWRFSDSPRGYPAHGFRDVPAGTFYDLALRWARAEGVTTGIAGTNRYAPLDTVDRKQMITFVWRAAGSPTGFPDHGFLDVPATSYYEQALRWAANRGITTGVGGQNIFQPDRPVTRAEAVTFLHRLADTPSAWTNPGAAPSTVLFNR